VITPRSRRGSTHRRRRIALRTAPAAIAVLGALLIAGGATGSSAACPWVRSHAPIVRRVASVMNRMTLAEEVTVVEGHGITNPYVFYMPGIARLCIPRLGLEDGPSGVGDTLTGVTQLPAAVALAATWSQTLARRYGQVVGAEQAAKGAGVDLGPTVNIDRDPRWGRSFEAYSEDPYLTRSLAVSEIDGVQSQRVMAQVKHFAAYNQETNRNTPLDDVIVSARALHEIYLPAFEAAVKQSHAASVMCAYSTVDGSYSCQSSYLLRAILKELWGFPGFVTSDFGAIHDTAAATAGTDMEQPSNTYFGSALAQAVSSGTVPRAVLGAMVQRILTEMFRFDLIRRPHPGSVAAVVSTPAHLAVATQVAESSVVLLKNSRQALPLRAGHGGTVAVIGPAASLAATYAGGGSSYVLPSRTVTPLQGLRSAAGGGTHIAYAQGLPNDSSLPGISGAALSPAYAPTGLGGGYSGTLTAPQSGTYVLALTSACTCYASSYLYLDGRELIAMPQTLPANVYSVAVHLQAGRSYSLQVRGASSRLTWGTPGYLAGGIAGAVAVARAASRAVVVVSDDTESEGADRPSLELPSEQNDLISAVAAVNPHTIVVLNAGAPVAMPWLGHVAAVIDAWYPGQTSGTSLARVLFGKVDPGGHLPVTFPANLTQVPAASQSRFPGGRGMVRYAEGIGVGYRWYEVKHLRPLFPFGYGLSYTRFSFSDLRITPSITAGVEAVRVSVRIRNIGERTGSDVVQLYLGDPAGAAGEPPRQLVGFSRVTLRPRQRMKIDFTITPRDTWWWDQRAGGWTQATGAYRVYVGDSSALFDLPLRGVFRIASTPGARRVIVHAPMTVQRGRHARVEVKLTAAGNETLRDVRFVLQVPEGWMVTPAGPVAFSSVAPSKALSVAYIVTPPRWLPVADSVLHATAQLGPAAAREAGTTIRLR
jgi:beta-glucosidase